MTNYIEAINNIIIYNYVDEYKLINNINNTYELLLLKLKIVLKIITNFKDYCFVESDNNLLKEQINKFNIIIVFKDKTPENIIKNINKIIKINNDLINYEDIDNFNILKKMHNYLEFSKIKMNYHHIKKILLKNDTTKEINYYNIPKNLLLNQSQIANLLINEIFTINKNKEYDHYINILDETNPYILNVTLFLKKSKCKMIEFQLIINQILYPFYPPELKYIQPSINDELLFDMLNLDILKVHNWSSIITIEYLITKLAEQLELVIDNYIYKAKEFTEFDKLINDLKSICCRSISNIINIPIPVKKQNVSDNGIGYSTNNSKQWDIKLYIKIVEFENEKIYNIISRINNLLETNKITTDIISNSYCLDYIVQELQSINLLEIEKKPKNYDLIFKILNKLENYNNKYELIANNLKLLNEEIETYKLTSSIESNLQFIQSICDKFKIKEKQDVISTTNYEDIMKKYIFNMYTLPNTHLFYKYKNNKLCKETMKRISTEIGSFKNGLPINYDSTIWVKVSKENINLITFIISGPKDTPYENGLFEFHGYLPDTYPNIVPQLLIKTTGNGKFRFNPNLYACGKVCLSLLNTWEGLAGESWDPNTSTFLQIMVSIQSLILIDKPYFNEPGYTNSINTPEGNKKADEYNNNIYPNTINYAMIDMIKNPPTGFEDIIKNHFKLKKDDINKTLIKWNQQVLLTQLNELINKL